METLRIRDPRSGIRDKHPRPATLFRTYFRLAFFQTSHFRLLAAAACRDDFWSFLQMDRKNRHLMKFPNDFENLGVEEQKVRIFLSPTQCCGSGIYYGPAPVPTMHSVLWIQARIRLR
jgi:hypothetical protein